MNKTNALKRATQFLLLFVSLPLACSESETVEWYAEEEGGSQEETAQSIEREMAEVFAQHHHTSVDEAQNIANTADNYFQASNRNLAALKELDIEQIMRDTGATLDQIKKAFAYYRTHPVGALPITSKRIQELAQMHSNKVKQHHDYRKKKREKFKKLNIDEIRVKTGATEDQMKQACTYFRSQPYDPLPVTLERIKELAEKQQQRVNRAREYNLKKKNKDMPRAQQAAKKQASRKGKEKAVFEEEEGN